MNTSIEILILRDLRSIPLSVKVLLYPSRRTKTVSGAIVSVPSGSPARPAQQLSAP